MEKIISRRIDQFINPEQRVGATFVEGKGVYIRLWAPNINQCEIEWLGRGRSLLKSDNGYFTGLFSEARPGDRYYFYCDGRRIPDPASRYQPESVSGPSEVVSDDFSWTDLNWKAPPQEEWVIYEIHPGTFSEQHNFEGIIADLPRLKDLGVTTLEIMPVSQFSGDRNWGYDGVFPHAVQDSYGGPAGFKNMVDKAHKHGLAVVLDVVYNHLGPEGNVLPSIAPYTQDKYHTPWGDALNFDGAYSDEVRRYFLQTVWQWLTEYHLDGLRLDAIQTILDTSPIAFLQEVSLIKEQAEKETGRPLVLIAETDMNDARVLDPLNKNGFAFDGHWADDLHHALHVTLTGENTGYYEDYGGVDQLAKIYANGVAFQGDYSPFRKRMHGKSYAGIDRRRLVVQSQNHDQIGNRLLGDRLSSLVNFEKTKLAAAAVLLSPCMPLLFMGEELYAENPFQYFISHSDKDLVEAVRKGRKAEWKSFNWSQEPPDPAAISTFEDCVLKDRTSSRAITMQSYYKKLISLSKQVRQMDLKVTNDNTCLYLDYTYGADAIKVILSFSTNDVEFNQKGWECILKSDQYLEGRPLPVKVATEKNIIIPAFSATVFKR